MVNNRTFTVSVLFLFLIYLAVSLPKWKSLGEKKLELKHLIKLAAKEKFIAEKKSDLMKAYSRSITILRKNESYLLPPASKLSSDMNFVQSIIEKSFKENGVEVINLTWGEQVEKDGYYKLSMRFSVRGLPNAVFSAFEGILNSGKLFRFERLSISKQRIKRENLIMVAATLVAYKLKKRSVELPAEKGKVEARRPGGTGRKVEILPGNIKLSEEELEKALEESRRSFRQSLKEMQKLREKSSVQRADQDFLKRKKELLKKRKAFIEGRKSAKGVGNVR